MKIVIFISAVISIAARGFAACHVAAGPNITGGDLASVNAAFATLDPSSVIAPAPTPGVTRTFHAEEILRIAQQNGIALTPPVTDFCFERPTETLSPEKLLPILPAALADFA